VVSAAKGPEPAFGATGYSGSYQPSAPVLPGTTGVTNMEEQ